MWLFLVLACRPSAPPPSPVPVAAGTRWAESPAGLVLEVATDHYRTADGREVWVVGSVHVAEPAFYQVAVARLRDTGVVRYEGLIDDEGTGDGGQQRVATLFGLQAQADVPVDHPGWRRADLRQSELRQAMVDAGVPQADIERLLGRPGERSGPDPEPVPEGPTALALAKLALIKQLAEPPDDDPLYQRWLLAERDEHAVASVDDTEPTVGLWYGADHLPGIGRALQQRGFLPLERTWTPAIGVGYTELQLGPAQVQMLMKRKSSPTPAPG